MRRKLALLFMAAVLLLMIPRVSSATDGFMDEIIMDEEIDEYSSPEENVYINEIVIEDIESEADGLIEEPESKAETEAEAESEFSSETEAEFNVEIIKEITMDEAATIAETSGSCGDNMTWSLDGGVLTISGNGAMKIGIGITGAPWYSQRTSITSIVIEEGVTSISSYAFYECSNLTSVKLADSIVTLGYELFVGCTNLKSINYPLSLTTSNCLSGSSGSFGPFGGSSIEEVTIPYGVKIIAKYTFSGCDTLTSIVLPDSVTSVDEEAFNGCSSLKSVTLSANLTSIDDWAFYNCSSLSTVTLPDTLTYIGSFAFRGCTGLTDLQLPDSIAKLGRGVFLDCTSLTEINYPLNLQTSSASTGSSGSFGPFYGSYIQTINIPSNVTSIPAYTFAGCTSLESIVLPDSVTSLGKYAFHGCTGLKKIILPSGISSVGWYAFYGCSNLAYIFIPKGVTEIDSWTFYDCSALTDVYYAGSEKEWSAITISSYGNDSLTNAVIHYNSTEGDGDISASIESENKYFVLGEDTNQFYHTGLPYTISNSSYLRKLYVDTVLTWVGTVVAYSELDGTTDGVCHGIALSMCYGNQGGIDFGSIVSGATNYWEMGNPLNDTEFSDLIVYYQMTQHTAQGDATNTLDKDGWHLTSLETRTKSFLKAFVDEAKSSQESETPFVFSFHYTHNNKTPGHSVVVCGYSWNSDTNCHEIKIYDENSYSGSKDALVYYTMTVSSDYSSFKFSDWNARNGGYTIEDTWTSLSYYGIQKVYSEIDTVSIVSSDLAETVSTSSGRTTLQVSVGKKFKIVNASGEWLQYNDSGYTGTMTVYDCYTMGAGDNQIWNLIVDISDSFTLVNADAGCQLICEIGGQGYSYVSNGEEQVVLSSDKIEVTGESYALDIAVQSTSCDMVKISANVSGNASISIGSDIIQVDAEGTCSDMKISSCSEFDTDTQQIDEEVEKVVISQSGDIEDVTYGRDSENGLCLDTDGIYRYYVKGEVDTTFNGIAGYNGGQFFVANGILCSDANGLNLYDGVWYFLANGQIQTQYIGLVLYDGEWFYITSGVLDTSKNGLVVYDGEQFLVADGQLLLAYNGLWQNAASIGGDDLWYFIGAGMVQNVSQVVMYDGAWFVVENGVLNSDYNGTIEYDGTTFTVVNGQLYG